MKRRIIGIVCLLPLLFAFCLGGIVLEIAALLLTICGIKELYGALKYKNINALTLVGVLFCAFMFCYNAFDLANAYLKIALIVGFMVSATLMIVGKSTIADIAVTWFGAIYVIWPINEIVWLYEAEPYGRQLATLIFIIAFSTDIFAYLVGCKFGKHKLSPSISPNKTIEGSVGGIVGSVIMTILFCIVCDFNICVFVPISIISSIASQIGDLFASSIKRYAGIKDFGNLIPGHGGVLDRFDSVLFVAIIMSIVPHLNIG